MSEYLKLAKILLRQPTGDVMTGYTPDGKACFVGAGAWTTTDPRRGDVIYFYSSDKGRVGHVGIVEKVDTTEKIVYTIEGNTRSDRYAENGGCVARHSYTYRNISRTSRVNGFGRPDFARAGVTADQFVDTAIKELGYMEKASNRDLDSKTANRGSNNFQKFQRDIGAGNGDQWCQYFVDAVALYCVKASKADDPASLHEEVQYYMTTKKTANVRTWAGKKNSLCSFSPIPAGERVGVCDTLKGPGGVTWYYIQYKGKHGFMHKNGLKSEG